MYQSRGGSLCRARQQQGGITQVRDAEVFGADICGESVGEDRRALFERLAGVVGSDVYQSGFVAAL